MKKILLAVLVLSALTSDAQIDSAKLKPTVVLQARDCEVILYYTQEGRKKLQDLDSVLLSKWRPPATNPTGTTNVTIDSVEARVWNEVLEIFASNPCLITENSFSRLQSALSSTGHSWLTAKIVKQALALNDAWAEQIRKSGRQYGRKEDNSGFSNQ
jgi:hypothetical protein